MIKRKTNQTEKALWRKIKPILSRKGAVAIRIETTTMPGFPDAIWFPPKSMGPCLIELKAGSAWKLRPAQAVFARLLADIGYPVFVIYQKTLRSQVWVHSALDMVEGDVGTLFEEWVKLYMPEERK